MPFQFRKEAIEEDLNTNFPSQGQGNPPLYYSLSEVVVPTYSINQVAEGSTLPQNLQTAWDFSTGFSSVSGATSTLISNPGFWQIDFTLFVNFGTALATSSEIFISDGVSTKNIWRMREIGPSIVEQFIISDNTIVVFVRSGDTVQATVDGSQSMQIWYRQIAALNGDLINPLGYSAA